MVLADEPTGNLDSTSGATILELLHEVVDDAGAAMVLVTHDEVAARLLPRTLHVQDGRLVPDPLRVVPTDGATVARSRRVLRAAPAGR